MDFSPVFTKISLVLVALKTLPPVTIIMSEKSSPTPSISSLEIFDSSSIWLGNNMRLFIWIWNKMSTNCFATKWSLSKILRKTGKDTCPLQDRASRTVSSKDSRISSYIVTQSQLQVDFMFDFSLLCAAVMPPDCREHETRPCSAWLAAGNEQQIWRRREREAPWCRRRWK